MERTQLNDLLKEILESDNVYYQPPSSVKRIVPYVEYKLVKMGGAFANGARYTSTEKYQLTYVYEDPEDPIVKKLLALPYCSFQSSYKVQSMYHTVFEITL